MNKSDYGIHSIVKTTYTVAKAQEAVNDLMNDPNEKYYYEVTSIDGSETAFAVKVLDSEGHKVGYL